MLAARLSTCCPSNTTTERRFVVLTAGNGTENDANQVAQPRACGPKLCAPGFLGLTVGRCGRNVS